MNDFNTRNWYSYLTKWQKQLVEVVEDLVKRHQPEKDGLADYSFLVFPMSKAYEGFLKKFLFDLNLIDQDIYEGRRFRIGRALNPDVSRQQRDKYWLYDNVAHLCSPETAREMWTTWLECRNRVFHYFPKDDGLLTFDQAVAKIEKVSQAMSMAVACYRQHKQ